MAAGGHSRNRNEPRNRKGRLGLRAYSTYEGDAQLARTLVSSVTNRDKETKKRMPGREKSGIHANEPSLVRERLLSLGFHYRVSHRS